MAVFENTPRTTVDFQFTEEQLMIQDVARRIAQERIAPSAEHHDQTGEFPLANMKVLGENGLMGVEVPAEYGGAGMDPISYVLAMIEVATADEVMGDEGHGFKIAMGVLDAGRIGIASQAIGIARAAYEKTLEYVKERKAFGAPIGTFQMTQAKIADMKCKLDAATLLTLR